MENHKTIPFILFAFMGLNSYYAQQTLEFNQVKYVTTEETVPNDKVWKVESALPDKSSSGNPYIIKVDGNETFVGEYIGSGNHLTNLDSIAIFLRKTSSTACTYSTSFYLDVGGFEDGLIFQKTASQGMTKDNANTTFNWLMSITPQTSGGIIDLTELRLRASNYYWRPYELKMEVYFHNGTSDSYIYSSPVADYCNQYSSSAQYYIGSSTGNMQVPIRSKDTYYSSVRFPFWLKSGQKLESGNNILGISVLEFNVN